MMKLGTVIPYLKIIKKIWKTREQPLRSVDISSFSSKISNFCYIKKCRYRLHFNKKFLILLTFSKFSKVALTNMVAILMMSAKLATLGLLKLKVFRNKGNDIIISAHDVTNKILSRDSNYIVVMVMWPEFGNSNISMTEIIITSIL